MRTRTGYSMGMWVTVILLTALAVGCGDRSDRGSGGNAGFTPAVSSVTPLNGATGVPVNRQLTATFSVAMDPSTIVAANFLVTGPGGASVAGSVAYIAADRIATFTPASNLVANTTFTARITTGAKSQVGLTLASDFVWTFTTGATLDTTRPTVTSTNPANAAIGVPINQAITAVFSEVMDPATITAATFTVTGPGVTPVTGTVTFAIVGTTATFAPSTPLAANTTFTATITTGAKDLAFPANALASNFVWTFTTGATADTSAPTVGSTNPASAAVGVCINKSINATFSKAMNPLTITTATFTLATTAGASVTGLVAYDPLTNIATFNPTGNLAGNTSYTATIIGGASGVKDLAGNPLAANKVTTFTTGTATCATAPALGAAAAFGNFGGAGGITNQGIDTVINGDIGTTGASTLITGFHDVTVPYAPPLGCIYTETPLNVGAVNGAIFTAAGATIPSASCPLEGTAATAAIATAARAAALAAFTAISPTVLLGGIAVEDVAACPSCGGGAPAGPGQLGGRTLPPGVYKSTPGTFSIGALGDPAGNLTLDAQGDANAVWVFQTAAGTGTLTVGLTGPATPAVPIQVLLINGAQAKNVFWYVPAGATIGTGSTMVGTMLSDAAITFSTAGVAPLPVVTTLNGRAIALTAGTTIVNTVINVPAP